MPSILDTLRSLHEKATPAPWGHDSHPNGPEIAPLLNGECDWTREVGACCRENGLDDAALIVATRNNLGALLAVVGAARAASTAADGDPLNDAINTLRATLSALDVESGS